MITRKDILEQTINTVCTDRESQYGSPEDNFSLIAELWTIYRRPNHSDVFTAEDVAIMMALLKIARISTGSFKADNYIDLAGYAACGGEIASHNDKCVRDYTTSTSTTSSVYVNVEHSNQEYINKLSTIVSDLTEKLEREIDLRKKTQEELDRYIFIHGVNADYDTCRNCLYYDCDETDYPCKKCMHNCTDMWVSKKEGANIL